ncbi:phosphoserine phosphatase SerB [Methyloferula stellata]|uniref:phosphoserine phosphatase SerB n=1 Tax=Methyloferula stellata TaxID=876270 RepID=UPI00036FC7AA|nr:phosphoserine phosphatase SerB [Methyloferula stellata]
MTHVATLVCDPSFPIVQASHLELAAGFLPGAQAPQWLDQGVAADITFTPQAGTDLRALADQIRAGLHPWQIDVVLQPVEGRRKKLLLADMDSTVIGQECINELAQEMGKRAQVTKITEQAMAGEIDFETSLRERVTVIKNLRADTVNRILGKKITITNGARVLVQTMRANRAYTVLVTSGFSAFAAPVTEKVGFNEFQANVLGVAENRFTGLLEEPVLGTEAKRDILIRLREKEFLPKVQVMAVGDGANDLAMLAEAGLGVAFHAKPAVAAAADARIDHADLTALLYLQGYQRSQFWSEERKELDASEWMKRYGWMARENSRKN